MAFKNRSAVSTWPAKTKACILIGDYPERKEYAPSEGVGVGVGLKSQWTIIQFYKSETAVTVRPKSISNYSNILKILPPKNVFFFLFFFFLFFFFFFQIKKSDIFHISAHS